MVAPSSVYMKGPPATCWWSWFPLGTVWFPTTIKLAVIVRVKYSKYIVKHQSIKKK